MFNQVKVTLINLYYPIIPSTQLSAIFFGQIFSSKSCWIHVDILFKQTIFKTYHLNVFFSRIEHTKTPKKRTERRHENFQLSSFSLADFQRKLEDSGRWLDSGKITKLFFKKLGWSCRETQPWKRYEKVHRWVWWTWFFYHRFCSKRHAMAILHGLFLGDMPSLKTNKRPVKIGIPEGKGWSPNHHFFRGYVLLVSGTVYHFFQFVSGKSRRWEEIWDHNLMKTHFLGGAIFLVMHLTGRHSLFKQKGIKRWVEKKPAETGSFREFLQLNWVNSYNPCDVTPNGTLLRKYIGFTPATE